MSGPVSNQRQVANLQKLFDIKSAKPTDAPQKGTLGNRTVEVTQAQARAAGPGFFSRAADFIKSAFRSLFGGGARTVTVAAARPSQSNMTEVGSGVDAERERGNRQVAIKTLTPQIAHKAEEMAAAYRLDENAGSLGKLYFGNREFSSVVNPIELKEQIAQSSEANLKLLDASTHLSRNIYGQKPNDEIMNSNLHVRPEDKIDEWAEVAATQGFLRCVGLTLFKEQFEPLLKEKLLTKMESAEATAFLSAVDGFKLYDHIESKVSIAVLADPSIHDTGYSGLKTTIDKAIEGFVNRGMEMQKAVDSFEGIDDGKRLILQKFVKDTVINNPDYFIKSPQVLKAAVSCGECVMKLVTASKDQIPESIVSLVEMMNSEMNSLSGEKMERDDINKFATAIVDLAYRTSGMSAEKFFTGLKNNLGQFELTYDAAEHVKLNSSNHQSIALAANMVAMISGFGEIATKEGVIEIRDQLWGGLNSKDLRDMGRGMEEIGFKDFPKALQDAIKAKGEIDFD